MKRRNPILPYCLIAGLAAFGLPGLARDSDGTLDMIRFPISSRPALVLAGATFELQLQHTIDVNGVEVDLVRGGETIRIHRSDPRDVFPVAERRTFDLPTWDCLVDGWKMSWMWRPRVTVRDLVRVPVSVPASVPEGLYALHVWCSAGADTSERAVRVLHAWPDEYRIVHMTDFHLTRDDPEGRPALLRKVAAAVNAVAPDLVICTGDNTDHNYPDEHKAFLDFLDALDAPSFAVGGNHDTGGMVYEGHADTLQYLGDPYYTFDFGDHHYTGIDNATRFFDEEQVAWLKQDLAAAGGYAIRALFGHALYLQSKEDEAWFNNELFPAYDVALHLYGHFHRNEHQTRFDNRSEWVCTAPAFLGHFTLVTVRDDRIAGVEWMNVNE